MVTVYICVTENNVFSEFIQDCYYAGEFVNIWLHLYTKVPKMTNDFGTQECSM